MRVKTLTIVACVATGLALAGCRYINYHPYDVDVDGKKMVNVTNARLIESQCAGKDTIIFAATGDTQGWYDETKDFVKDVNRRDSIMFVVHDGDLTDYGTLKEFEWQRNILSGLKVPYVCDIGNHDCLGTGKEAFLKIFGPANFTFIAGRVKFINLNTNALEYDYGEAVPDLDYIEQQDTARAGEFDRCVVTMHARPYSDVFNNNVAKAFEFHYLHGLPGLLFCINGHGHSLEQVDIYGDGIVYYQTPNIEKRQYCIFKITPGSYSYEVVSF